MILAWLHSAIVKIVTTYTRPGDRVLLLTPLAPARAARWPGSTTPLWPARYAGLDEAAWTVVRLGRGIRTQTVTADWSATTAAGLGPNTAPHTRDRSESGPGPAVGPYPDTPRTGTPESESDDGPHSDRPTATTDSDRFDVIITAVYPRTTGWLDTIAWADHLHPRGVVAVITHSDREDGWLLDPTSTVVAASRRAGLTYLDHIALLEVPLRHGRLATPAPTPPAGRTPGLDPVSSHASWSATGAGGAALTPVRVHSDLHVFGAAAPGTAAPQGPEASDV